MARREHPSGMGAAVACRMLCLALLASPGVPGHAARFAGAVASAEAVPGDLDVSFGRGGTRIGPQGDLAALARQPDGRLVAAGGDTLVRYDPDGHLDRSFARHGIRTLRGISATAVAVQDDRRIVAAGSAPNRAGRSAWAVVRYLRNGRRDRRFARGGLQVTRAVHDGLPTAIALQRDGKIVAAGFVRTRGNRYLFALVRYRRDGRLDRSFSGDGVQRTEMGHDARAFAVALQADGRIVVAGLADTARVPGSAGGLRFVLARYSRDGHLDRSFSADGILLGPPGYATAVAVQRDGKIVAAGSAHGDFALVRYLPDGHPDAAFSDDGEQTTSISPAGGDDTAAALALAPDGKLVVAGVTQTHIYPVDDLSGHDFAIARYLADGRLDESFSADGVQTTHVSDGGAEALALVLQPDGRAVAGGVAQDPGGGEDRFALARYVAR